VLASPFVKRNQWIGSIQVYETDAAGFADQEITAAARICDEIAGKKEGSLLALRTPTFRMRTFERWRSSSDALIQVLLGAGALLC
jgi:hypothetical protein